MRVYLLSIIFTIFLIYSPWILYRWRKNHRAYNILVEGARVRRENAIRREQRYRLQRFRELSQNINLKI